MKRYGKIYIMARVAVDFTLVVTRFLVLLIHSAGREEPWWTVFAWVQLKQMIKVIKSYYRQVRLIQSTVNLLPTLKCKTKTTRVEGVTHLLMLHIVYPVSYCVGAGFNVSLSWAALLF